ncbi:MAG: TonB-dependent receptor [Prevotellaceae bacterium]|jgi:TonB-linked SusC/RagA family outer membrane protein|nr:TonB-dependent receptor [Prevotellaceae bacterium]
MKFKIIGIILCMLACLSGFAQTKRITGHVKDAVDGSAISGVTVLVKNSNNGTATDSNGEFSITVAQGDVLVFSMLGKKDVELVVGQRNVLEVVMYDDETQLEEVTVVAFGTQRKASVIASIESVKVSDLKQPASNLTGALAGRIPGIISYQLSGEPGADNAKFFVRGVTTFGYKQDPLILIDGFEASTNDLARMQPDDIESFSVLKDASATVLYGARGANGILMVSTKSGREGSARVDARFDVHIATPTMTNEFVDGVQYMKMYNEARISRNPSLGAFYDEQKIQSTMQGVNPMIYPNVNWYDELFNRTTVNKRAHISVSGGGQVATYYVVGGYENENGLLKVDKKNNFNNNINIDRFNIRSNVVFKLTSTTTLDTRIQGRFDRYTGPWRTTSDIYGYVMNSNPVDFPAVYEPDEARRYQTDRIFFGSKFVGNTPMINPYAEMVRGYQDKNENTITAMATLSQDLGFVTDGLKLQLKGSVNTYSMYSTSRNYTPFYYDIESYNQITGEYKLYNLNPNNTSSTLGNNSISGRNADNHYYFEARANWDRKFGKHSVGLMTVGMIEEHLYGDGQEKIEASLPERNAGNSGRLTYDYDSRYFFEFSYGYNGSEKFTGDRRYGFFPSFGAGWLASNEKFWEPLKNAISMLKLKATYGLVGNDAISGREGRFFYLSRISYGGGSYRWGQSFMNIFDGYSINRYANLDITWEKSSKYNFGIELGLFGEAVKLQADVFKDIRSNIYLPRSNFPATTGLESSISGNVGKAESQGVDASVDIQHSFSKDLWITGRANFTYATNKYVELDEKDYQDKYLKRKGHNTSQWWGLIAERLFVDQNEIANSPEQTFGQYMAGDIKYKDVNNDGKIDQNDRVPLGYPTVPEIQYGFGLSIGYRQFDLSFFFQGNARVSFFIDASEGGIAPFVNRRNALAVVAKDYWTETSPDVHAFWPRLSTEAIGNNTPSYQKDSDSDNSPTSSWWMRDGSFLRLKSAEIGYNFSGFDKIGLKSGRIYFSAENLFVLSSFKLWDPEMGRNGLAYPPNRRLNIGIQLSF